MWNRRTRSIKDIQSTLKVPILFELFSVHVIKRNVQNWVKWLIFAVKSRKESSTSRPWSASHTQTSAMILSASSRMDTKRLNDVPLWRSSPSVKRSPSSSSGWKRSSESNEAHLRGGFMHKLLLLQQDETPDGQQDKNLLLFCSIIGASKEVERESPDPLRSGRVGGESIDLVMLFRGDIL